MQSNPNNYKSIIQTFFNIIKYERINGLYKGFVPELLSFHSYAMLIIIKIDILQNTIE